MGNRSTTGLHFSPFYMPACVDSFAGMASSFSLTSPVAFAPTVCEEGVTVPERNVGTSKGVLLNPFPSPLALCPFLSPVPSLGGAPLSAE